MKKLTTRSRNWIGIAAATAIGATIGGIGLVRAADSSPGNTLTAITPCRLIDTRDDTPVGERLTPIGADETATFAATGDNGNCVGITADATAISIHVTAVNATEDSFFTMFPTGETEIPTIAQVNFDATPAITSNSTTVTLSGDGTFDLFNRSGDVDLVVDLLGYYAPGGSGEAGPAGEDGKDGAEGPVGPEGPAGPATPATYENPEWGVILRNTIGTPTATLRSGPMNEAFGGSVAPPFGVGSLELILADGTEVTTFGNAVDFVDDEVQSITELGFYYYATAYSNSLAATNVPGFKIEVDPNGAGERVPSGDYATMVFTPNTEAPDFGWTPYIDATDNTAGTWFLTFAPPAETECILSSQCTWDELQTYLDTATEGEPTIHTFGVGKGRDDGYQGAIDGVRVNATVYDFEPLGVIETPAPAVMP